MCWGFRYCTAREHIVLATFCGQNIIFCRGKMVCWGWRYCTAREHLVLPIVCGQNVKICSCNLIPSTPCYLCKTFVFVQVTVLGFSYLCATQRSQIFHRVVPHKLVCNCTVTHTMVWKLPDPTRSLRSGTN